MRLGLSSLLLLSASLLTATAHADVYQFTFNATGQSYTEQIQFSIDEVNDYGGPLGPTTNIYDVDSITDTYNDGSGPSVSYPPPVIFINTTPGSQTIGTIETDWSMDNSDNFWNGTTFVPNSPGSPYVTTQHASSDTPYNLDIVDLGPSPVLTATPEPSSLALLGTGFLGLLGVARRRFVS